MWRESARCCWFLLHRGRESGRENNDTALLVGLYHTEETLFQRGCPCCTMCFYNFFLFAHFCTVEKHFFPLYCRRLKMAALLLFFFYFFFYFLQETRSSCTEGAAVLIRLSGCRSAIASSHGCFSARCVATSYYLQRNKNKYKKITHLSK